MVIGGIQGDEPGGYLTGDINRKFGDKDKDHKNLEQEIVSILKGLIDESDCLLNLHEGSGWYNPEWKNEIDYVLVQVNNDLPYAVPDGSDITVAPGDEVTITDIIANFDRGLAADFENLGSYNDTKLPFRISQPTKVLIRKDAETCGWVNTKVSTDPVQQTETDSASTSNEGVNTTIPSAKKTDS